MIIGFKERFLHKIESGTKIHTIRVDKKEHIQVLLMKHLFSSISQRK